MGVTNSETQLKIESREDSKKPKMYAFLWQFLVKLHLLDFRMLDFHIFECHARQTFMFEL